MGNPPIDNRLTDDVRMLLEHVRDAVLLIRESDGRIVAANNVAQEMYGYTVAQLLEMRIFDLLNLEGADPTIPTGDATRGGQITEAGAIFEASHKRADGTTFPVENSARIALIEGERTVVAIVRDITARRLIERATQDVLDELNQVFDTAGDGMRVIDRQFNVTRVNHTLAEVAGIDYETAKDLKCYEAFPGKTCHTPDCALVRALQGGQKTTTEVEKARSDGSTITCLLTARPFEVDGEIVGVIEDFRDITERKSAEELAQHLATHDTLTGLPNRLLFTDRLEVAILQAERHGRHPGLMFCDIDHFKAINDTLGHATGDKALQSIAASLSGSVRAEDTVARLGGDEFVVLLPNVKATEEVLVVARKVLDATGVITAYGAAEIGVTLSVGIAVHEPGEDADALMRRADDAMYRVKDRGGNGLLVSEYAPPAVG